MRNQYEQYILNGSPFASWNNPSTMEDETMGTFMTIAYKFCEHAENSGEGYLITITAYGDFASRSLPGMGEWL